MWARLRTSIIKKDKKTMIKESQKGLNVNEEYFRAVRTKSCADFFLKVQLLINEPSEILLDPCQETITSILQYSKTSSDLKSLLFNYFDISAEASKFCSQLLKHLNQVQSDYTFINHVIENIDNYSTEQSHFIVSDLVLSNPFSQHDFKYINDKHSSVLQHLKSKRKRVARKIKFIKYFNKASGVCVTAAFGLVAAAAMFLALHTLTALLMGPALFALPIKPLKKKILNIRFLKYGFLRKIGEQLDVAAKGAYILNRDFDTMGRLVARLQDEIEHNKAMIRFCLERRDQDRVCNNFQVLKEIKKCEFGFRKQVEELEEHVYLCLVTINRARALVIKEISIER
ncbi:hypothetical protein ACJIZ3_024704 [Penstemon smallii]|uniref:Uncharacterized protein n=1 Tax=Penstemon smallii TaxID=265156 RepID=A0ABD3TUT4_9LAMI